jgi:hypothetical protein
MIFIRTIDWFKGRHSKNICRRAAESQNIFIGFLGALCSLAQSVAEKI